MPIYSTQLDKYDLDTLNDYTFRNIAMEYVIPFINSIKVKRHIYFLKQK